MTRRRIVVIGMIIVFIKLLVITVKMVTIIMKIIVPAALDCRCASMRS